MKQKIMLLLLLGFGLIPAETVNYLYCDAEMNKDVCDLYYREDKDLWSGQGMVLVTRENFGPYTQDFRKVEIKDKQGKTYSARKLEFALPNSWSTRKSVIANGDTIRFEDIDYIHAVRKDESQSFGPGMAVFMYALFTGSFYAAEWGQSLITKDFDWRRPLWYAVLPTVVISWSSFSSGKVHVVMKF